MNAAVVGVPLSARALPPTHAAVRGRARADAADPHDLLDDVHVAPEPNVAPSRRRRRRRRRERAVSV